MDQKYNYPSIVAVKIIVKKNDQILLLREPETNEWMPCRLGLPGGKLLLNESIQSALERKIKTEIGLEVEVKGLIKIIDILMPKKNIYHLIFLADYENGEIGNNKTESNDLKWYSKNNMAKFNVDDCAEFYNAEILKEVFEDKYKLIPLETMLVQDNRQADIMEWMEKGNNK